MRRHTWPILIRTIVALALLSLSLAAEADASRTNFIIILCDNLGYRDIDR